MYEPQLVNHDNNCLTSAPQALNLRIRPSGAADRERLKACFGALSPESRRMRFFASKHTLSDAELDLFSGADGWDHIAVAAVRLDDQGRETETLGFARCIRLAPGGDSAEFSMSNTTVNCCRRPIRTGACPGSPAHINCSAPTWIYGLLRSITACTRRAAPSKEFLTGWTRSGLDQDSGYLGSPGA